MSRRIHRALTGAQTEREAGVSDSEQREAPPNSAALLSQWTISQCRHPLPQRLLVPVIIAALRANARRVIHPALSSVSPVSLMPPFNLNPLSGLLVPHIRRGDYIDHCARLTVWSSHFMGFDEFPPPQYRALCFPDVEQIVVRVREVRASLLLTTRLSRAYVLTNGRSEWLEVLKDVLQDGGLDTWVHIGTSRDLNMTKEQQHNAQAMDMAVA
ncbi:hypothetical protein BC826DRAFT_1109927 [Russula brevipes]|nr:hypothetical protein BC826DRAFT_1109927 [Russula brevipes]